MTVFPIGDRPRNDLATAKKPRGPMRRPLTSPPFACVFIRIDDGTFRDQLMRIIA